MRPPTWASHGPPFEHCSRHAGHFCHLYPWGPGILGCPKSRSWPVNCRRTQGPGSPHPPGPDWRWACTAAMLAPDQVQLHGGGAARGLSVLLQVWPCPASVSPHFWPPPPWRSPRPKLLCPCPCGPIVTGVSVQSGLGDCLCGLFHPLGPRCLGLMPAALSDGATIWSADVGSLEPRGSGLELGVLVPLKRWGAAQGGPPPPTSSVGVSSCPAPYEAANELPPSRAQGPDMGVAVLHSAASGARRGGCRAT